jgi:luciferase family oxidoreductase group 1
MTFPLSVLDLTPIPENGTGVEAFQNSIDLAQHAEGLGYKRYWVAEHHNMGGLGGVAPEVLIGVIAQRTRRIQVGSGGVLVPNYAPLKVAELFRTLEALTPGRIDAGLGRAPNMDPRTVLALRGPEGDPEAAADIARQIAEVEGFGQVTASAFPYDHPLHDVIASPEGVTFPPIFLLGSGQLSAQIAAARGRGFAAAYFFSPGESQKAIQAYKAAFQPSPHFPQPHAILTVAVVCAETDELAQDLARAGQLTALRRLNRQRGAFASVAEARAYRFTSEELDKIKMFNPIVGTPERVREQLTALVEQIDADELMLTVNIGEHALRRAAYTQIAEVFGLVERPSLVAELVQTE